MKIYQEILRQSQFIDAPKPVPRFQVLDTAALFWRQVSDKLAHAQTIDASPLLASYSQVTRYTHKYERSKEFTNLSPFCDSLWVELTDSQIPAHFAVLLLYDAKEARLADEAGQYGITGPFQWRCQARCFMKKPYESALPLRWEWSEFIDERGLSVGSLLQPSNLPRLIDQCIARDLGKMDMLHHELCAFIANLGLYTVDVINSKHSEVNVLTAMAGLKPEKGRQYEFPN